MFDEDVLFIGNGCSRWMDWPLIYRSCSGNSGGVERLMKDEDANRYEEVYEANPETINFVRRTRTVRWENIK